MFTFQVYMVARLTCALVYLAAQAISSADAELSSRAYQNKPPKLDTE